MGLDLICKEAAGEVRTREKIKAREKEEPVIVCRTCGSMVTKPEYRLEVSDRFSHTFANPHGHVFEIGCFSRAPGCVAASLPSDDFSWFKGYEWEIGVCRNCTSHLGWIFSDRLDLFYGLILDKLVFP